MKQEPYKLHSIYKGIYQEERIVLHQRQKISSLGIASFTLSLIETLSMCLYVETPRQDIFRVMKYLDRLIPEHSNISLFVFCSIYLIPAGLGVIGLFEKNRAKALNWLSIFISLVSLTAFLLLLIAIALL